MLKLFLVFLALLLPELSFAADSASSQWSGLSGVAKSFFDWFNSLTSSGTGSDATLMTAVIAIERMSIILFAIVSRSTLVIGLGLAFIAALKYLRHSEGKEQISSAHLTLLAAILIGSAYPLLQAAIVEAGFSGDDNFQTLSNLAQSCAGVMGEVCSTGDADRFKEAILFAAVRFFRLVGFVSFLMGLYGIYENGKPGGQRKTGWAIITHIVVGVGLYILPELLLVIGNSFFPNTAFTDFMRQIKQGSLD